MSRYSSLFNVSAITENDSQYLTMWPVLTIVFGWKICKENILTDAESILDEITLLRVSAAGYTLEYLEICIEQSVV